MSQKAIFKQLKNTYFAIRHGQSQANVEKIIISLPENGLDQYGLTTEGKQQVRDNLEKWTDVFKDPIIYSSDFLRTRQTARIIADYFQSDPIFFHARIRERCFGNLEKKSSRFYSEIWELDCQNPAHSQFNVESAEAVSKRVTQFILEIDSLYENEVILIVSHGDVLQILSLVFYGLLPAQIRAIAHLKNAEIRRLNK